MEEGCGPFVRFTGDDGIGFPFVVCTASVRG